MSWPLAAATAANVIGGIVGSKDKPQVNWDGAKEGIGWKVRDAKRSGIHPLYAIGAPAIGGVAMSSGSGRAWQNAAEGVSRSISNYATRKQQKPVQAAQTANLHAQVKAANASANRDNANALYYAARASKLTQGLNTGGVAGKPRERIGTSSEMIPKGSESVIYGGQKHKTHVKRSKVDSIGEKYGDFVSDLYGFGNWTYDMGTDLGSWLHKKTGRPKYRRGRTRTRRGYKTGGRF